MPKNCLNCAGKGSLIPVDIYPSYLSDHERVPAVAIVIEAAYCTDCGVLHESYEAEPG